MEHVSCVDQTKNFSLHQTKCSQLSESTDEVFFITQLYSQWIMATTFFSLVDVVNVYGDKNFLSGVHTHTKKNIKITKKKNKNTKLKVRDTRFLLIFFFN